MDIIMNYSQGITYMKNLCQTGSGTFSPESTYPELIVTYPGYKQNGDYRVNITTLGTAPTHFDVCQHIYNGIQNGKYNYNLIVQLLEDIYACGTDIDYSNYPLNCIEKLTTLIYWMTLQDEINYPQPRFQGRKMPFSRYFEAAYCAFSPTCTYNINTVGIRCSNRRTRPQPYNISGAPSFYC